MDPLMMTGLTTGISALGSYLTGQASGNEARRNRRWLESMSNTAYQRAVVDLKKAGLNPVLAAFAGGASTPGSVMPTLPDVGSSISNGLNAGSQALSTAAQVKERQANIKQIETTVEQAKIELGLSKDAVQLLKQYPYLKKYAQAAKIAQLTGISPNLAAAVIGIEQLSNPAEGKGVVGFIQRLFGTLKDKWYEKEVDARTGAAKPAKKKLTEKSLMKLLDEAIERTEKENERNYNMDPDSLFNY